MNLIHEIPLPPPGKLELSVNIGQLQLFVSRPAVNTISALQNVRRLHRNFECLCAHCD